MRNDGRVATQILNNYPKVVGRIVQTVLRLHHFVIMIHYWRKRVITYGNKEEKVTRISLYVCESVDMHPIYPTDHNYLVREKKSSANFLVFTASFHR